MHHRLQWFIHVRADGLDRVMSTPPMLSCGVWLNYLFSLPSVIWHCWLGSRKSSWSVKNWLMRCWCGCMSGVRCKWSAYGYGLADATAIPKLIISHFIKVWMDTFLLSGWLGCLVIVFSFCFNICGRFSKVLWMNNGCEWTDSSWCGVMDNLPDAVCRSHLQVLSENLLLYPVFLLTLFYLLLYCASWQCKVSSKWLLLFTTLWNLTNLHYITSSLFVTYL